MLLHLRYRTTSATDLLRHATRVIVMLLPWLAFCAILLWRWGGRDLFHTLPAYGDALEEVWGFSWYGDAIRSHLNSSYYPLIFAPQGWIVATFGAAVGPGYFLAMAPLYWLGGAAFAYNATTLLTFVVAFGGTLKLARRLCWVHASHVGGTSGFLLEHPLVCHMRPPEHPDRLCTSTVALMGI